MFINFQFYRLHPTNGRSPAASSCVCHHAPLICPECMIIVLEPCSLLIVQNNEAIDPLRWSVDGATPTGDVVCRFFSTKLTAVGRGQSPAQLVTNALYLVPVVSEEVTREHVTAIRTGICNPIQR